MRQICHMSFISHKQLAVCGLSRISYTYLKWVAMSDKYFRQRANIGITQSCMHWYVKKNFLTWVKTMETPIWCARNSTLIQFAGLVVTSNINSSS